MLWYYRFCGVVANIALVLNMLMLVAIMLTIKAAFTLTGFAGLGPDGRHGGRQQRAGLSSDLREELERGATLRMAIRNAFQRAGATIIDCNLTHLIAATVLYIVGTDQLRGFAVTLWLGVAISMFTSVFVARVIFEIADKRQWITQSEDDAHDRPYEHRLHGLVPHLRYGVDADHGDGHRRVRLFAARACSTSTSPAACRCRPCSTSRRIPARCERS